MGFSFWRKYLAGKMAIKETKAQRVERLKREKNPWEALEEIRGFARRVTAGRRICASPAG